MARRTREPHVAVSVASGRISIEILHALTQAGHDVSVTRDDDDTLRGDDVILWVHKRCFSCAHCREALSNRTDALAYSALPELQSLRRTLMRWRHEVLASRTFCVRVRIADIRTAECLASSSVAWYIQTLDSRSFAPTLWVARREGRPEQ